jgi:hypothetical protein
MGFVFGNESEMMKAAEVARKYDDSLAEIYAEKMQTSKDEILQMMSEETWFSGEEAVAAGLSTAVESTREAVQPNLANWFRNAPKAVYEQALQNHHKPKVPVHRIAAELRLKKNI